MNRQSASISYVMKKAFDKVLPIPKSPRFYHPPPPPKPLSWVPHGRLGDQIYETKLRDFAAQIEAIESQRTNPIKTRKELGKTISSSDVITLILSSQ